MLYLQRYCPDNNYVYSKAVDATASEVNTTYYADYKTIFCWGIQTTYFITKNIMLSGEFNCAKYHKTNYISTEADQGNFRVCLGAKYNY